LVPCGEGIHFSSGQSSCNRHIGSIKAGLFHWISPSAAKLTACLGPAFPVLQPIRTPLLSFFYWPLILPLGPDLQNPCLHF
jgi:hypothetical protein